MVVNPFCCQTNKIAQNIFIFLSSRFIFLQTIQSIRALAVSSVHDMKSKRLQKPRQIIRLTDINHQPHSTNNYTFRLLFIASHGYGFGCVVSCGMSVVFERETTKSLPLISTMTCSVWRQNKNSIVATPFHPKLDK